MKLFGKCFLTFITAFILLANISFAEVAETEDKTLSPYFFVKSEDRNVDQLPLKSTSATGQPQ